MYKLNFNHLFHFLTIAKEGSIVKASKKLSVTQPALSHQLKQLELDLGKQLFDRKGKRLVINKEGKAVREYASKIFRHSEEMLHYIQSESDDYIKIIKVGTVPWLSNDQIYDFIRPLLIRPHIRVEVYQKDLDTLLKEMQAHMIDIILCDSPYSGRSKKLTGIRLALDPIVCVSSVKLKGKFPKSIHGMKVVTYADDSTISDKIDHFLAKNKTNIQVVGAFNDTSLLKLTAQKIRPIFKSWELLTILPCLSSQLKKVEF